jgi:hypothetical protein
LNHARRMLRNASTRTSRIAKGPRASVTLVNARAI